MAGADSIISFALDLLTLTNPKSTLEKETKQAYSDVGDMARASKGEFKNIKTMTRDSILQYPMLYTNDISQETMDIVTRSFEADYAYLLKLLIASDKVTTIDETKLKDGKIMVGEYLKQFHTNIYTNGYHMNENVSEKALLNDVSNLNKINYSLDEMLDVKSLNSYSISRDFLLKESILNEDEEMDRLNKEKKRVEIDSAKSREQRDQERWEIDKQKREEAKKQEILDRVNKTKEKIKTQLKDKEDQKSEADKARKIEAARKNDVVIEKKQNLKEPLVIKGNVFFKFKDGSQAFDVDLVFAVKGVTHLLDYEVSKYFVEGVFKNHSKALQFIKWRSGELKLFKDILFAYDYNKSMALKTRDKDTAWWHKLEAMSHASKSREVKKYYLGQQGNVGDASIIPTATLCMSYQMVEELKKDTGIDLFKKPKLALGVIHKYFLLSLAIIDESTDMLYLFNESSNNFDRYSFSSLKSKSDSDNKSVKELKELSEIFKR